MGKSRLEPAAVALLCALSVWLYSQHVGKVEMIEGAKAWLALRGWHLSSPQDPGSPTTSDAPERNPFVSGAAKTALRYHPWLTAVVPEGNLPMASDYFGFRNRPDPYFRTRDPRCRTVVITGNSEAVGTHVLTPMTEALEQRLEQIVPGCWRAVNLAMSGLTTAEERNNFITLGYDLEPDFVISHSGPIDVFNLRPLNGLVQIEAAFAKLAMIYGGNAGIAVNKIFGSPLVRRSPSAEEEAAGAAVLKSILLFQRAAETRNAHFIWGIQKFGISPLGLKLGVTGLYFTAVKVLGDISRWARENEHVVDVIDFNTGLYKIVIPDGIHSTQEGTEVIANVYAARIAAVLAERESAADRRTPEPDLEAALKSYSQRPPRPKESFAPILCKSCILFTRWGERFGSPGTQPAGTYRAKRKGRSIRIRAELERPYDTLLVFSETNLLRAAEVGPDDREIRLKVPGSKNETLRLLGLSSADGTYSELVRQ